MLGDSQDPIVHSAYAFSILLAALNAPVADLATAPEGPLRAGDRVRLIVPGLTRGWLEARLVRLESDTLFIETRTWRQRYLALPLSDIRTLEAEFRAPATLRDEVPAADKRAAAGATVLGLFGALLVAGAIDESMNALECYESSPPCLAAVALGLAAGAAVGGTIASVAGDAGEDVRWVRIPVDRLAGTTITPPPALEVERSHDGTRPPLVVRLLREMIRP